MNKNVPKLRFKEFSDEYRTKIAKELFESISDKKHNGELNVLSVTQDRGVLLRKDLEIDIKFDAESVKNYKRVKESDFIISLRSFQGGFEISNQEGLISPAYTVFNFKDRNRYDSKYFSYIFKSDLFIKKLAGLIYGVRDGKAISFSDFKTMKFNIPSLQEQEKIADFFNMLDSLIEEQDGKVKDLETYKKGMMQKIFSQEIRFKDENGCDYPEWGIQKLEKYIIEYVEKTIVDNQYPVLTSSRKGIMLQSEYFKDRQVTTESNIGYFVIPRGYTTFRSRSDDGVFVFNENTIIDKGIISYFYPVFKFENTINTYYARLYMNNCLKKDILREIVGTSQLVLSMNKLKKLKITIPCLEEQNKIADFLSNIDDLIKEEKSNLEDLKEMKKGLLQQMFV